MSLRRRDSYSARFWSTPSKRSSLLLTLEFVKEEVLRIRNEEFLEVANPVEAVSNILALLRIIEEAFSYLDCAS